MPKTPNRKVLLVHGIFDTGKIFKKLRSFLDDHNWETFTIDLSPPWGIASIPMYALQVEAAVRRFGVTHLVGFSMGGIVCRYFIQAMRGDETISSLTTIGSPHRGSLLSWLYPVKAAWQMRPSSQLILDLHETACVLKNIHFTNIWTPYDLMVFPAYHSQLTGIGKEVAVKAETHGCLLVHPVTHSTVLTSLEETVSSSGTSSTTS